MSRIHWTQGARTLFYQAKASYDYRALGSHRWRWTVRLLNMLAEVHFAAGRYDEAAPYNELGIDKASSTSSQKYLVNALALRGKLKAQHGDMAGAGADFEKAASLAEKLSSPTILYPIAHDFREVE